MRLALGGFDTETNTFSATPTRLEDFVVTRGDELLAVEEGTRTYLGGMIERGRELGATLLPLLNAYGEPSGLVEADAYRVLKEELLERLAAALPLDAVALSLHGAAVVDGVSQPERDLLAAVREVVGTGVPIVATLDLHGNVTQVLADAADLLLGCREYPHVDLWERGWEAVDRLPALVGGTLAPVAHVERLPMLMPISSTFDPPLLDVNRRCEQLEALPGVLDVTLFHGFVEADVAHAGTSVVATTDGDAELARKCARQVAALVWERREELIAESIDAEEAVRRALLVDGGPVVLNETSDNPGGGAPGDGTHLLRALLAAEVAPSCFGFVCDPEVVRQAIEAGPRATIEVRLGAKTDELHGTPIEASARVVAITDGCFTLRDIAAGMPFDIGPMARLRIGATDVLVSSRRAQTLDAEVFLLHGIDVRRQRLVGLKSSHHFKAGFGSLAAAIVTADPPGLTSPSRPAPVRRNAPGPMWPQDRQASYP